MDDSKQKKIAKSVGLAIARHRAMAGLTQEEVAEQLNIGNEAISRMERGAVLPTVARLFEFAELFDCRVNDLMFGASDRTRDQASEIALLIGDLAPDDREMVVGLVKTPSARLQTKPADRKSRS